MTGGRHRYSRPVCHGPQMVTYPVVKKIAERGFAVFRSCVCMSLAAHSHNFMAIAGHYVMVPYSEHMRHKAEFSGLVPAGPLPFLPTIGLMAENHRAPTAQSVLTLPAENYSTCIGTSTLDQSDDLNLSSTKGQESSIDEKSQSQDDDDYKQGGNKGLKAPWTPEVHT